MINFELIKFFQAVVSGAAADVSQVSRIVGDLDLSNQQSASVVERTLVLYAEDENGNRVTDVSIEPASIVVTVPVAQRENTRTFAVRPNIQFATLPENYVFRNFKLFSGNNLFFGILSTKSIRFKEEPGRQAIDDQ